MPENNQILSVEGQLVGMPLAGPETFTTAQVEYLKRAMGIDETVLFESSSYVGTFTTSEAIENFEFLKLIVEVANGVKGIATVVMTNSFSSYLSFSYAGPHTYGNNKDVYTWRMNYSRSGNTFTISSGEFVGTAGSGATAGDAQTSTRGRVYKVIGIHRISGGNE